jgi:hypothetical protein
MAARVLPPSPDEIALRTQEIRRRWSPQELERRCVHKTKVVYVPVAETYFTDRSACCSEFRPSRRLMRLD